MGYTYAVEKERAYTSGRVLPTLIGERGITAILITAAISVIALLAVAGWQIERGVQQKNAQTAFIATGVAATQGDSAFGAFANASSSDSSSVGTSSADLISYIGPAMMSELVNSYTQLQQNGSFSVETAQKAGEQLAPSMRAEVSYHSYTSSDLRTDSDTSYKRMIAYRGDLQTALRPLLNNTEPEYAIFAQYVSTGDTTYLTKLKNIAQDYRDAVSATANVVVPVDATAYHVAILNAMEEFASTLDAMSAHASDPFASAALLRTYNQAEQDMLSSFNALTTYEKSKQP